MPLEDLTRPINQITAIVTKLAKLVLMGVAIFCIIKIGCGLYHFLLKLAGTLPTWPAR